jgi:hypothetical protein
MFSECQPARIDNGGWRVDEVVSESQNNLSSMKTGTGSGR